MYKSARDIVNANKTAGRFFFSDKTMEFFATKFEESKVIRGRWLLLSDCHNKNDLNPVRIYRAVCCNDNGHILQIGTRSTKAEARADIDNLHTFGTITNSEGHIYKLENDIPVRVRELEPTIEDITTYLVDGSAGAYTPDVLLEKHSEDMSEEAQKELRKIVQMWTQTEVRDEAWSDFIDNHGLKLDGKECYLMSCPNGGGLMAIRKEVPAHLQDELEEFLN